MSHIISKETITELRKKLNSKRTVDVYNACVDIRKNVSKTQSGINGLVYGGMIPVLLGVLKRTSAEQATDTSSDDPYRSKVKDIICSILGNLCMLSKPRDEVLKHDGVKIIDVEAIQNRSCRCIANMCYKPGAWELVLNSESEIIEKIVKLLKDSENPECQQTYIRAIRLLGQTGRCVQKLLDKNAISAVMKYVDSDSEAVTKSAIACIAGLVSIRNTIQFAGQVVSSGKLSPLVLVVMTTGTPLSHEALPILLDLSEQHNFRPAFGNAGGISLLKKVIESSDFTEKEKVISVLCLCCKEVVNRVKLREEGLLKHFIEILKDDVYVALHLRIVSALVCFLYDETSFDVLLEYGLVSVLVLHLRKCLDDDGSLKPIGKTDQCISGVNDQTKDVYGLDKLADKSPDSAKTSSLEKRVDVGNISEPSSSEIEKKNESAINENLSETTKGATEDIPVSLEDRICSKDPLALSVTCTDENNPSTSKMNPIYSIDSPTYKAQADNNLDYISGAKCKRSFSPQPNKDRSYATFSPISNISYYSPAKSSPEYSPLSDRSGSPSSPYYSIYSPSYSRSSPGYSPCSPAYSPCSSDSVSYSPSSQAYVHSDVEREQGWSWSPDDRKESSSDDNEGDDGDNLMKTDVSAIKANLTANESLAEDKEVVCTEKKADRHEIDVELFSENEDKTKTQKPIKKRKKSDNAMENNIFILLSRVSQMTNPTMHFVATETISCLLDYIIDMEAPLARCARLLSRVFRNPHCFQKLLLLKIPVLIYEKLLQDESIPEIMKKMYLFQKAEKGPSLSSGFRSRSSSMSPVSSDSDRFSLFEETTEDEGLPAKRRRGSGSGETIKREVAGELHKQSEELCDPGKCGMSFLEDLAGVSDSPYGRGVVEKLIRQDQNTRQIVCFSALYLCRNQGTIDFYHRWDIFTSLFNILEEKIPGRFKIIVQGFSLVAHLTKFKSRFQSSSKGSKGSLSKTSPLKRTSPVVKADDLQEVDAIGSEPGTTNDIPGEADKNKSENQHSYSCKECLCTFSIPCVLHSNHTCVTKDVTFIVKGERLLGCRNTLTNSSELFAAMLEGHYSESSLSEIEISETSKFAFKYLLHYLHGCKEKLCLVGDHFSSGQVSEKSVKRLIKVLKEADKYLLYDLKFELQELLFDRYIIPEMAPSIFEYAVMYDCLKIQRAAVSCVLINTPSQRELLSQLQKCIDSKFAGVFINTLMEMLLG